MQLFCPVCQGAFTGTQRCPRCGGLLLLPQEAAEVAAQRPKSAQPTRLPSPTGRVFVGGVFALGTYLGMRKLVMGGILATHQDPDAWWATFEGLSAVCAAQVIAVLFGSVVAAAGRNGGLVFGAAVGALCGGLFLAAELLAGAPPQDLVLYVQPLVLVCAGAIAGVFAARVWGAVPILEMPIPNRATLSSSRFVLSQTEKARRPTAWFRILVGAVVMVLAVAVADKLRSGAQKYSGGLLRVESIGQGQFLTWQLAVMGVLGGGVLAAAGTGAGLRHGMMSGFLGGVGVLGLTAAVGETLAPVEYWLSRISLDGIPPNDPIAVAAATAGILLLGILGGWLGGTLFLPLAPPHLRKSLGNNFD
jgi:hypothetical protein